LAKHPKDLKALWELANAQSDLGEGESESKTLLTILELTTDSDRVEAVRRLCKLGRVSVLPTLKRLQYADQCKASAPEVTKALLRSVVEGPRDDSQRPDAMLALVAIERESQPEKAKTLLIELMDVYPMHPAAELARKRGWVT
jgi:hypothetical protein